MKHSAMVAVASILCLGGGPAQAQFQACGGDYVCTDDSSQGLARPRKSPSVVARLTSAPARRPCADGHADVIAETPDDRDFACAAVGSALQLWGDCGIAVRRPLRLEIIAEVRHPLHNAEIFGFFDAKRDLVRVTQLVRIPGLINGTPFANLPVLDVYRSVIVHEVIHALVHQNLKRPILSHAANEYPAYALQLESLPQHLRNKYMRSFNQAYIDDQSVLLNDIMLFFNPFFFAARAHHHFKLSSNGCAHISNMLEGRVDFISILPEGF